MFPTPSRLQVLVLLGASLLLAGCGGGGGGTPAGGTVTPPPPPPANTIYVGEVSDGYGSAANVFEPTNLSVAAGTSVTFVWKGDGHTVDSGTNCAADGHFSSDGVKSKGFQKVFAVPADASVGTIYHFLCQTHCSTPMVCTITVK